MTTIEIDYGTHKYPETWAKEGGYCPNCGKPEVWADQGGGDYYQGNNFACLACGSVWTMPSMRPESKDDADKQRIAKLRDFLSGSSE